MKQITLEQLLEAGCHFGHQVTRSNPKARDFVFESRDNIQIIDLAKTKQGLDEAADYVRSLGQRGGKLIVVGTKKQARQIVEEEVARVRELLKIEPIAREESLYYVTQRWIGGILTNFSEVSKNFKKLSDLKDKLNSEEEKANYTKREIGLWDKEKQKLEVFYKGIATMKQKPDALFIIDSHWENLAVREALSTSVPTVAIVDTNADPYIIDYPIPANDDAVGSIKLIVTHILDAFAEGVKDQKAPAKQDSIAPAKTAESSVEPKVKAPKVSAKQSLKPSKPSKAAKSSAKKSSKPSAKQNSKAKK